MAKNTYENQIGRMAPQMRNHFELAVEGVPGFTDDGILILALARVSLPREESQIVTLPYLNTELKYAGRVTTGDLDASFYDFCDQPLYSSLLAWRRQVYIPGTQRVGLPSAYKKTGILSLYSSDFSSYIKRWRCINVWCGNVDPGDADMSSNEQVMISTTIHADKIVEFEGFE